MSRSAPSKVVVIIAWCATLACEPAPAHEAVELRGGELPPAFVGQTLLTDEPRYTRMFAAPYRSSIDGRVGVYAHDDHELRFDALVPEKFADSVLPISQHSGPLAADAPVSIHVDVEFDAIQGTIRDPVLCEGHWGYEESGCVDEDYLPQSNSCHGRFYEWSDSQNPYTFMADDSTRSHCTQEPGHECYDMTLMFVEEGASPNHDDRLWSMRVQVTVADAKTATAHVESIEILEAPSLPISFAQASAIDHTDIRSPSVTGDGRLLVMSSGSEGLVYAYNAGIPCSVDGWDNAVVKRISRMRNDPEMFGVFQPKSWPRYGLAAVGFRDPNRPANPDAAPNPIVPLGQPIYGGAPWVDRRGSNLLFTAAHAPSYDPTRARLELHANGLLNQTWVEDNCDEGFAELVTVEGEYNVGAAIMGLSTDGKLVMLDGGLNLSELAIDFTPLDQCIDTHADPQQRAELEAKLGLLITGDLHDGEVEYYVTTEQFDDPSSVTAVGETAIHTLASLENRLHQQASARPALPRNLVALVSNDRSTHELAFDDYTNVNNLVIANMMPSLEADPSFGAPHRIIAVDTIQNEANWRQHSRSRLETPHHGELVGSPPPRVEPYARGGVHGRGIYLSGSNGISFNLRVPMNAPPPRPNQPVQLSLWINPDDVSPDQTLELLSMPDGTVVSLLPASEGLQQISIGKLDPNNNWISHPFTVPADLALAAGKWSHIGFFSNTSACADEVTTLAQSNGTAYEIEQGDSIVEFFVDGTLVAHVEWVRDPNNCCSQALDALSTPRYFRLAEGELRVGTTTTHGFVGWIDELRLSALYPSSQNYEEMCNLAYGSLRELPTGQGWASIDADAHSPVRADLEAKTGELPAADLRFICDLRDAGSADKPWVLRDLRFDLGSASPSQCVARIDLDAAPPAPTRDTDPACIDEQLLYPEGPLTLSAPRPDSSFLLHHNRTCVNCHINAGTLSDAMTGPRALGLALDDEQNEIPACADRRRREGQTPARMFGLLPSSLDPCAFTVDGSLWVPTDGCFMPESAPPPKPPAPPKTCPGGGTEPDIFP